LPSLSSTSATNPEFPTEVFLAQDLTPVSLCLHQGLVNVIRIEIDQSASFGRLIDFPFCQCAANARPIIGEGKRGEILAKLVWPQQQVCG